MATGTGPEFAGYAIASYNSRSMFILHRYTANFIGNLTILTFKVRIFNDIQTFKNILGLLVRTIKANF